ncbi:peptidase inhibitor 16 isoform X3 [Ochotona curzoniae]|uniref:peptidase inhibitor 16 isoform X3 n=1 Tax=Ochotona curzoniae TaxID=130825 RepID=UPI001B346356|nr:peptidase inhibitor 16 isoform X3 [Ochotona curzoniae]
MHSSCSLLALLLSPLLLLLLLAAMDPSRALSADERRVLVELHNLYRAQVSPSASDMLQMRWDEELAAFAKAYAQKCVWGHNKERGRRGENLFAITDEVMDVPLAMEEWYQEHAYYNLSAATCAQGQVCGHYTQVVWAKTERIGCGTHFCEKLEGVKETNIQILVCNYEPPGNVKGKRPYQEGTPCSQCPSGYRCENKLCEPIRGPEEAQDLPDLQSTSNLATEALGTGKSGAPSLAKESPSSPATGGTGLLATKALPAAETRAPSSLVTTEPFSMATEAMSSSLNEGPSTLATPRLPPLEEEPDTLQQMTQTPSPKPMDTVASETSIPSLSPQTTLSPKIPLPGTGGPSLSPGKTLEPLPQAQWPPSSEILASDFPVQNQPGELQAILDHMGHTSSKSLSSIPNASAIANATGGRTLALQASLPGKASASEKHSMKWRMNGGHMGGPLQGLVLLPLLVLAAMF